jgi:hypothetical protein
MKKTKEQIKSEIAKLQKELKELEKSRFATVKFSDEKDILLKDEKGYPLVETWLLERDANDFKWFEEYNVGQFLINGNIYPVEFFIKGEWVRFDERIKGRFLRK